LDAALQSMAGEVASKGITTSSVYMPLVQTKMVESKGHSYDHVSLLTLDMACDLIEHAIMTKEAEVTDGPSRFLALLHFFRPSLIVGLNSLVYGLEGERPPDTAAAKKVTVGVKRQASKKIAPGSGFSALKALGSLLGFFSRLEMFFVRLGVAWIVRDPIIILLMLLVLVVQPIVVGMLSVWRLGRRNLWCDRQLQARRGGAVCCKPVDSKALSCSGVLPRSSSLAVIVRRRSSTRVLCRAKTQPLADTTAEPGALRSVLSLLGTGSA